MDLVFHPSASQEIIDSVTAVKTHSAEVTRVYARQCELKEVSSKEASEFYKKYHVHGTTRFHKAWGLYYKGELLTCMSIGTRMIQSRKESHWEISRDCTKFFTLVVGGYSRMLKAAVEYLHEKGIPTLITYADAGTSPNIEDTFYFKDGWRVLSTDTGAMYCYRVTVPILYRGVMYYPGDILSRQQCQHQKLAEDLCPKGFPDGSERFLAEECLHLERVQLATNYKFDLDVEARYARDHKRG